MEERQENLLFNDTFRFKDLPDTSTPHNAPNMNIALDNTSYLKKYIEDIITGKVDLVVKSIKSVNLFDSERWYNELQNINQDSITKEIVDGKEYYKLLQDKVYTHPFMKGEFKENTQYTLIAKARNYEDDQQYTGFRFGYTDGTSTVVYVKRTTTEYDYKIVSDKNKTIQDIKLGYDHKGYVLFRDIMMYEGTDNKEYSPHQF